MIADESFLYELGMARVDQVVARLEERAREATDAIAVTLSRYLRTQWRSFRCAAHGSVLPWVHATEEGFMLFCAQCCEEETGVVLVAPGGN